MWRLDPFRDVWEWVDDGTVTAEVSCQALAWAPGPLADLWAEEMRAARPPEDIMRMAAVP